MQLLIVDNNYLFVNVNVTVFELNLKIHIFIMQIKKIYIVLIIIFKIGCNTVNEKSLFNKQSLIKFQKELINKEITGSNEIVIFKDDSLFYRHTENTNNKYDKKINNETIFALWSTSKVVTTIGMFILKEKNSIK